MTASLVSDDRHIIVLSPHFDDAVLSLGGLLAAHRGPSTVVTAHGGPPPAGLRVSGWDSDCGFVRPEEAYTMRLGEDRRACALLGARQVVLPNADGPYGAGRPIAGLEEFLTGLAADAAVFVPLGLIQPDHRAVRDVALPVLRGGPATWIYADLPYTAADPGWPRVQFGGSPEFSGPADGGCIVDASHEFTLDDATWSGKRDAVLCYASQLSLVATMLETDGTGALLGRHGPLSTEVVWRVARP
ncbi:putative LmbE-like protein [Saccharomonospora marina XMU15]|uniref:Putative LmbE-like protein n=1 Tax=Saccharomonospora marina XMU15 TaxID=882083 RepID=H5X7T9_9PSEU|nr:PIG-L family deacetylase [Saccharomonospora marina]EHR52439.1 putative LmbE-like protein [Saccharomonospora marina XMU15]